MKAKAAAESSPHGIAVRYDSDGYCWLFKPTCWPRLVIATDIPCGTIEGDVMWRQPHDWSIVFAYDDWKPVVQPTTTSLKSAQNRTRNGEG
jgi:hypothetical protein